MWTILDIVCIILGLINLYMYKLQKRFMNLAIGIWVVGIGLKGVIEILIEKGILY